MSQRFRVTYATLSADNEDLHAAYDDGLRLARSWFGETIPARVSGEPRADGPTFDVISPVDQSVLCHVHEATQADIDDAVSAAAAAAPAWTATPWQNRIALLRRRRPDQRAVQRARRADEHGGRQNRLRRSVTSRRPPT
jgi:1-pyrroline-5-carboxylate dehydrogenase